MSRGAAAGSTIFHTVCNRVRPIIRATSIRRGSTAPRRLGENQQWPERRKRDHRDFHPVAEAEDQQRQGQERDRRNGPQHFNGQKRCAARGSRKTEVMPAQAAGRHPSPARQHARQMSLRRVASRVPSPSALTARQRPTAAPGCRWRRCSRETRPRRGSALPPERGCRASASRVDLLHHREQLAPQPQEVRMLARGELVPRAWQRNVHHARDAARIGVERDHAVAQVERLL